MTRLQQKEILTIIFFANVDIPLNLFKFTTSSTSERPRLACLCDRLYDDV